MTITNRDNSLDILCILACMMVVMMHSPVPLAEGKSNFMLGAISYLMAPCNGLFFMVSGALLFGRGLPLDQFLKKRLGRIIWPVWVWSMVYILVDKSKIEGIAEQLLWIPFYRTDACGYLWFMYALVGCYFLVPIVEPWLMKSSRREQEMVLGVWLVASLLPIITVYLNIPAFDEHSAWYYLGGFFGYFLLGWYTNQNHFTWKQIAIAFVCSVLLMVISYKQANLGVNVNCYLHPYVILLSFVVFASIKKLFAQCDPKSNMLVSLASCTFGVYLIHSLLLNTFLKQQDILNELPIELGIFLRWGVTVIIGFSIMLLLRKIPGHKYLIG